jgi:tRNA-dihydrouridine synthase
MYKGTANWHYISKVKDHPGIDIPIFGNGDVDTPEKALEFKKKYNVDGIMIGRASIGNPWIFNEIKYFINTGDQLPGPSFKDKLDAVRQHLFFSVNWKGERKGIYEMRRHYTNYFRGIPNFKPYRNRLVALDCFQDILALLDEIQHVFEDEYSIT